MCLVFWPVGKTPEQQKEINFQEKLHWGVFTVYMLAVCGVFVLAVYMNANFSPKSSIYLTIDGAYGMLFHPLCRPLLPASQLSAPCHTVCSCQVLFVQLF